MQRGAWRELMTDYAKRRVMMVDTQVRPADVTKFPIIAAMLHVPREAYVPVERREAAYVGENIAVAPGRVMLDPRTLAKMLDALDIQPAESVLDLGCGLGYSTAVIARLARSVVGVEEDATLAGEAQRILTAQGVGNAAVMLGPLAAGVTLTGSFDVIVLQGGVESVPDTLTSQLNEGGRIGALFMRGGLGTARIGYRIDGRINWRDVFNAAAPLLAGFRKETGFVF